LSCFSLYCVWLTDYSKKIHTRCVIKRTNFSSLPTTYKRRGSTSEKRGIRNSKSEIYTLWGVLPQTDKINYSNAASSPTWSGGSASGRGRSDWNVSRACHDAGCRGFASCNEGGINGTPLGRRGTCAQQADAEPTSQAASERSVLSSFTSHSLCLSLCLGEDACVCLHSLCSI